MIKPLIKWIFVIILILVLFLIYRSQGLHRQFKSQVQEGLERTNQSENSILTEKDIAHLPIPVQNYLKYVGALGKEKVKNFKVTFTGSIKTSKEKDWSKIDAQQYSFTDNPTRLFFLKSNISGLPVIGLHSYKDAKAVMLINLLGLIPVVDGRGNEMNQGETVTVFNDMCLLAPATLIDERIEWELLDSLTAKATFTNDGISISALLYFNEDGQLINFESDDRYYSPTGTTYENVRWSTPVSDYKNINGFNLPSYGEAIWGFPEGEFCYAQFNFQNIVYNTKSFE